jgi:hypothetical protein
MLLDQIFAPERPTELVIIRKNGEISHKTRPARQEVEHDRAEKPLFPISKERS